MERTRRSLFLQFGLPLLAIFLLSAVSSVLSDDIAGCGGFVRLSKELQSKGSGKSKLPHEKVHVELVSADGELVKERAECAPNGYYFLPIYDKGSFHMRVHGPKGWNFDPNSVLIDEGRCDPSRDYNFFVTGFVLSGTVRSLGQAHQEGSKGPAGVVITLKNKLDPKAADRTTTTGPDGAFHFDNVFPGTYAVVASHPSWTFVKDHAEVSFEWDNVEVKDELLVGGFEVSGNVQSVEENAPVSGVHFILFSASDLKDLPVSCTTDGVSDAPEEKGMKAVCGARSDAAGKFVIKGVPCGKYTLVPHYRSSGTTYDLLPASAEVTVSHGNLEVSQPFRVAGFSVEGRVVDVDGAGVSGATVLFDGVEKATTDADGRYRVEKVRVGSYAVEVAKDHVFFESFKSVQLSPSKAQVPQIKAVSYHLCGRVTLTPGHAEERQANSGHRDVLLVDLASGREERRSTDPAGAYCFEVVPGRYRVSPVVSPAEERAGLLFVPAHREVTLTKSPALDINFGQALVTVQGVVRCLEAPCDPSISITLTGIDIDARATASLSPGEKQEATYAIRDVLPGLYEVQIKHESWCWKQSTFKLNVKAEAETGKSHIQAPEFVHEGYMLSSVVSHDVKLVASLDSAPTKQLQTFDLTKGTNRFCLSKPGTYTLSPVSCYKFERDSYKYDTANPRLLDLQATHFLLNASVLASQPASDVTIHVVVDHSHKAGKDAHEEYHVRGVEKKRSEEEGGQHEYDFSIWVAPGEKLSLTPKAPAGSDLLFYPSTATFTLAKHECPAPLAPFQARPGSYVKGRVEPALANVRVRVYAADQTEGRRLVAESTTAANGTYSIGPLPDNTPYEIEAVQEGYHFRQTETGVFQAQKLGTVAVTVKDEAGAPLPGVVISLSGEGYRSNNPTNPQGVFTVSALHPGSYYLRPLLKEYVFQPSATSVEVKEGQDEKVTISAKRVAYSSFGKVRSLSGEAEKFVPVEAVSATGEVEETQTDAEGNFRLRGLQPGKEYRIRVKTAADQRIERASPADGYLVHLPAKEGLRDVQGQDFLVFRRLPKLDLTGEVTADPHVLSTLKVEVFEEGSPEVVKSVSLGPSTFFNAGPLARETKYLVRLSSNLSPRTYSHAPQEVSVVLNAATHLKLNFTAAAHDPLRHDLTSTPIFSFILAVLLVALVYYHKLALAVGKAALAGDLKGAKRLLQQKVEEEEDSATSFLSHLQQPSKAGGRGSARKNAGARPGNNRPPRT